MDSTECDSTSQNYIFMFNNEIINANIMQALITKN